MSKTAHSLRDPHDFSNDRPNHNWLLWVFITSWAVVIGLTFMVHQNTDDLVHAYGLPVVAGSLWMSVYLLFLTPELKAD